MKLVRNLAFVLMVTAFSVSWSVETRASSSCFDYVDENFFHWGWCEVDCFDMLNFCESFCEPGDVDYWQSWCYQADEDPYSFGECKCDTIVN